MLKGKIYLISETKVISDKFKKREFVLELKNSQTSDFTDLVKFEMHGDRVGLLDKYQVGQNVKIEYELKGREYTREDGSKEFYNVIKAFKIFADDDNF